MELVGTLDEFAAGFVALGKPIAVLAQYASALRQQFQMFGRDQLCQTRHQLDRVNVAHPQAQIGQHPITLIALDNGGITQCCHCCYPSAVSDDARILTDVHLAHWSGLTTVRVGFLRTTL